MTSEDGELGSGKFADIGVSCVRDNLFKQCEDVIGRLRRGPDEFSIEILARGLHESLVRLRRASDRRAGNATLPPNERLDRLI